MQRMKIPSDISSIFASTRVQKVDPPRLVRERLNVDRLEDISFREASTLIDDLKRGPGDVRCCLSSIAFEGRVSTYLKRVTRRLQKMEIALEASEIRCHRGQTTTEQAAQ